MLEEFGEKNPIRSRLYFGWLEKFHEETEFLENVELIDIPDTGDGVLPKGCKLRQLAVQREPSFLNSFRYTVNNDLYQKMSATHKAAMIFHELLFREARYEFSRSYNEHKNSVFVRYLNSTFFRIDGFKKTHREYFKLFTQTRFQFGEYRGFVKEIGNRESLSFIRSWFYDDTDVLKVAGGQIHQRRPFLLTRYEGGFQSFAEAEFERSGNFRGIRLYRIQQGQEYVFAGEGLKSWKIIFYGESYNNLDIRLDKGEVIRKVKQFSSHYRVESDGCWVDGWAYQVEFDEFGKVSGITARDSEYVKYDCGGIEMKTDPHLAYR